MKNYTIRDISKMAGVSFKTISRVVNNELGVKFETREKILKILKDVNYKIDVNAKRLSTKKINQLLVLLGTDAADPYIGQRENVILGSIVAEAKKNNYKIIVDYSNGDVDENKFQEMGNYAGVIAISPKEKNRKMEELEGLKIPIMVTGINNKFQYVGSDYESGAYLAAKHFCECGVKEAKIIVPNKNSTSSKEKIKGFTKGCKEFNIKLIPEDVIIKKNSTEIFQYFEDCYKKNSIPKALLINSDNEALGAIKAINKYKILCPEKIKIISFGNLPISSEVYPEITTLKQDFLKIGEEIVKRLISKIENKETESLRIQPKLIVRDTTCKK